MYRGVVKSRPVTILLLRPVTILLNNVNIIRMGLVTGLLFTLYNNDKQPSIVQSPWWC